MQVVDRAIFSRLYRPNPQSHKGQNGRLLVIAGSEKYHGALLMAVQTASRVVDMVYVHSVVSNLNLINQLKSEVATFIGVGSKELGETIEIVDTILIGPGLEENSSNKKLAEKILKKYPEKKIVLDATTLWQIDPRLLHRNCIVTPHSREFEKLFGCDATPENVFKMAKYYQSWIVLTGSNDYLSNGQELWENKTGNVGMTKGGTGDVLSGLIAGLTTINDNLTAVLAGAYLTGLAGDKLYEKYGTFFNAEDVIKSLGEIWHEYVNK